MIQHTWVHYPGFSFLPLKYHFTSWKHLYFYIWIISFLWEDGGKFINCYLCTPLNLQLEGFLTSKILIFNFLQYYYALTDTFLHMWFVLLLLYFSFSATPMAYLGSWAREQIQTTSVTYATAAATPDPYPTVLGWGWNQQCHRDKLDH